MHSEFEMPAAVMAEMDRLTKFHREIERMTAFAMPDWLTRQDALLARDAMLFAQTPAMEAAAQVEATFQRTGIAKLLAGTEAMWKAQEQAASFAGLIDEVVPAWMGPLQDSMRHFSVSNGLLDTYSAVNKLESQFAAAVLPYRDHHVQEFTALTSHVLPAPRHGGILGVTREGLGILVQEGAKSKERLTAAMWPITDAAGSPDVHLRVEVSVVCSICGQQLLAKDDTLGSAVDGVFPVKLGVFPFCTACISEGRASLEGLAEHLANWKRPALELVPGGAESDNVPVGRGILRLVSRDEDDT